MKRYFYSAAAVAMIALIPASELLAQQGTGTGTYKEKSKSRISEYDEIIIKQKDADKNGKVTVEINNGQVTVNGKPIDEFDDENISVRKRAATRITYGAPASPFRSGTRVFSVDGENLGEDHAYLGVTTNDAEDGVEIMSVGENTAAAKAGLKKGDVITRIESESISTPQELTKSITKRKPEEKVAITYKRDGKENKTTATLGKRKTTVYGNIVPTPPTFENFNLDFDGDQFGRTMFASTRPRLGIRAQDTEEGKGVKVLSVDDESIAEKAGIREDDIITEFEGKQINSADDLVAAARESHGKNLLNVKLTRDGKTQTVQVKIPKKLKTANL